MAAWLADPMTREWLKWLNDQVGFYRVQVPKYVVKGEMDKARTAAGALEAYEEMLSALEPTVEPVEVPEKPFIDPATRLSLRESA